MWGWKPVEAVIHNACSIEEAVQIAKSHGFLECIVNENHIVLRKASKRFYLHGQHAGLELHLSTNKEGLYMLLRYNVFIWFDTGDLNRFADILARQFGKIEETTLLHKVPHYAGA